MSSAVKEEFVILSAVKDLVSMSINQTLSHEILHDVQDDKLFFILEPDFAVIFRLLKRLHKTFACIGRNNTDATGLHI